jgi:hypothetical protein
VVTTVSDGVFYKSEETQLFSSVYSPHPWESYGILNPKDYNLEFRATEARIVYYTFSHLSSEVKKIDNVYKSQSVQQKPAP